MSLNGTTDNYLFVNNVPIAPKKYLAMLDYLWVNNNEIDMRRIRLTEGDLRGMIKESVQVMWAKVRSISSMGML